MYFLAWKLQYFWLLRALMIFQQAAEGSQSYTKAFKPHHCWFLEPWNREKSLTLIWQRFSYLLDEWIAKISKKKIFFEIINIIHSEMRMDSWINLKIFLGYDINYLSIWPFMGHPWFPTRKASKLIFVCFQLAGEWHHLARVTHKRSNA